MRQVRNGLLVGLVAGGVLLLSWWYGPYGPHTAPAFGDARGVPDTFFWIWSGFFAIVFLASVLAAPFYRHNITITGTEIVAETTFYWRRSARRIPRGQGLAIWIETIDTRGEGTVFPYRVHLLDAAGRLSGVHLQLGRRRSVDQMLEALRAGVTLDVRERPMT